MCGGTVKIFVHELRGTDALRAARDVIAQGRPVALAMLLDGPSAGARMAVLEDRVVGGLRHAELLDDSVARDARGFLDRSEERRVGKERISRWSPHPYKKINTVRLLLFH